MAVSNHRREHLDCFFKNIQADDAEAAAALRISQERFDVMKRCLKYVDDQIRAKEEMMRSLECKFALNKKRLDDQINTQVQRMGSNRPCSYGFQTFDDFRKATLSGQDRERLDRFLLRSTRAAKEEHGTIQGELSNIGKKIKAETAKLKGFAGTLMAYESTLENWLRRPASSLLALEAGPETVVPAEAPVSLADVKQVAWDVMEWIGQTGSSSDSGYAYDAQLYPQDESREATDQECDAFFLLTQMDDCDMQLHLSQCALEPLQELEDAQHQQDLQLLSEAHQASVIARAIPGKSSDFLEHVARFLQMPEWIHLWGIFNELCKDPTRDLTELLRDEGLEATAMDIELLTFTEDGESLVHPDFLEGLLYCFRCRFMKDADMHGVATRFLLPPLELHLRELFTKQKFRHAAVYLLIALRSATWLEDWADFGESLVVEERDPAECDRLFLVLAQKFFEQRQQEPALPPLLRWRDVTASTEPDVQACFATLERLVQRLVDVEKLQPIRNRRVRASVAQREEQTDPLGCYSHYELARFMCGYIDDAERHVDATDSSAKARFIREFRALLATHGEFGLSSNPNLLGPFIWAHRAELLRLHRKEFIGGLPFDLLQHVFDEYLPAFPNFWPKNLCDKLARDTDLKRDMEDSKGKFGDMSLFQFLKEKRESGKKLKAFVKDLLEEKEKEHQEHETLVDSWIYGRLVNNLSQLICVTYLVARGTQLPVPINTWLTGLETDDASESTCEIDAFLRRSYFVPNRLVGFKENVIELLVDFTGIFEGRSKAMDTMTPWLRDWCRGDKKREGNLHTNYRHCASHYDVSENFFVWRLFNNTLRHFSDNKFATGSFHASLQPGRSDFPDFDYSWLDLHHGVTKVLHETLQFYKQQGQQSKLMGQSEGRGRLDDLYEQRVNCCPYLCLWIHCPSAPTPTTASSTALVLRSTASTSASTALVFHDTASASDSASSSGVTVMEVDAAGNEVAPVTVVTVAVPVADVTPAGATCANNAQQEIVLGMNGEFGRVFAKEVARDDVLKSDARFRNAVVTHANDREKLLRAIDSYNQRRKKPDQRTPAEIYAAAKSEGHFEKGALEVIKKIVRENL